MYLKLFDTQIKMRLKIVDRVHTLKYCSMPTYYFINEVIIKNFSDSSASQNYIIVVHNSRLKLTLVDALLSATILFVLLVHTCFVP